MVEDLVKDIAKYLPSKIITGVIGFISIPIVTRLFPPADYGDYSLAWATVNILVLLIGWLSMSIIRFYPKFEKDKNLDYFNSRIVKLSFISILVIGFLFFSIIIVIKKWVSEQLYILMLIGIFLFALLAFFEILLHFLRSRREVIWYSIFFTWRIVFGFGLGILLIFLFNFGIEGLFWGAIISLTLILPLLWKKSVGRIKFDNITISKFFVMEISRYSLPLVVGNLAALILSLSDRYILQLFRGSYEVGIYSASYNISEHSVLLFVSLFTLAAGPIAINIWEKEGEDESKKFISKTTRFYLVTCIPVIVGLSVLSKPIIMIMTGNEYIYGYKIVPLVAFGAFFLGLQWLFGTAFALYKKTKFTMFIIAASGLLNLVLNFLLIPKYGYMAAAITTLFSYVVLFLLMCIFSRRFFVWDFPYKSLIRVCFSSLVMGGAVYFINIILNFNTITNLFLSVLTGFFVYFFMLFVFREPTSKEKQILSKLFNIKGIFLKLKNFR